MLSNKQTNENTIYAQQQTTVWGAHKVEHENASSSYLALPAARKSNKHGGLASENPPPGDSFSKHGRTAQRPERSLAGSTRALATPVGSRPVLGNKTTNLRTRNLQHAICSRDAADTAEDRTDPLTASHWQAKVALHTSPDLNFPPVEYMAPKDVPLPDYPEEWPLNRRYSQFVGQNFTDNWLSPFITHEHSDSDDGAMPDIGALMLQAERRPSGSSCKRADSRHTRPIRLAYVDERGRSRHSYEVKRADHKLARVVSNTTLGYSKGRAVSSLKPDAASADSTLRHSDIAPSSSVELRFSKMFLEPHAPLVADSGAHDTPEEGSNINSEAEDSFYLNFQLERRTGS